MKKSIISPYTIVIDDGNKTKICYPSGKINLVLTQQET
jgi:hypothetical protein